MLLGYDFVPCATLSKYLPMSLERFSCTNDLYAEGTFPFSHEGLVKQFADLVRSRAGHLKELMAGVDGSWRLWTRKKLALVQGECSLAQIAFDTIVRQEDEDSAALTD